MAGRARPPGHRCTIGSSSIHELALRSQQAGRRCRQRLLDHDPADARASMKPGAGPWPARSWSLPSSLTRPAHRRAGRFQRNSAKNAVRYFSQIIRQQPGLVCRGGRVCRNRRTQYPAGHAAGMKRAVEALSPAPRTGPDRRQPCTRPCLRSPDHRPGRPPGAGHFRRIHPRQGHARPPHGGNAPAIPGLRFRPAQRLPHGQTPAAA